MCVCVCVCVCVAGAVLLQAPRGASRGHCGPGPRSGGGEASAAATLPVEGPAPLQSLPLLWRISLTTRRCRGGPRATRAACRSANELVMSRRRRKRELFLQETAFRNSDSIS